VGEIYPPHAKCTRTRGRPFWGGYVYKWGLPLKSHECLQKISVLNTKYHLNLRRTLSYKEIIKALHCCEIYNTISTKKKHFTSRQEDVYTEIVLWTQVNKLFLEWPYSWQIKSGGVTNPWYFPRRGNCHIGKLWWLVVVARVLFWWPIESVCAAIPYLGFRPARGRTGGRPIGARPCSTQGVCPGRAIFDRIHDK